MDPVVIVWLTGILLFLVVIHEGFNGSHDTGNAIATVVYTKALPVWGAVLMSGSANALGVYISGLAVAKAILALLPIATLSKLDSVIAFAALCCLLIPALAVNFETLRRGIPNSSTYALTGSCVGLNGIIRLLMPNGPGSLISFGELQRKLAAIGIGATLAFVAIFVALTLLRRVTKRAEWSRPLKNRVGWSLLAAYLAAGTELIIVAPGANSVLADVYKMAKWMVLSPVIGAVAAFVLYPLASWIMKKRNMEDRAPVGDEPPPHSIRALLITSSFLVSLMHGSSDGQKGISMIWGVLRVMMPAAFAASIAPPGWAQIVTLLALGIGTMIGYQRPMKTIGTRLGKKELTYAQGATAEFVTVAGLGLAIPAGLSISTTQCLGGSVIGTYASRRVELNREKLKEIGFVWVATIPLTSGLSFCSALLVLTLMLYR